MFTKENPTLRERFPVFFGADGLRSGWRLLLFLLIAQIGGVFLFLVAIRPGFQHGLFSWSPLKLAVLEMWFFLPLLPAAAIMARIERRAMDAYGLPGRVAFGARFWEGALWGLGALTLLLAALRLTGSFYFGHLVLHGPDAWRWGAGWAIGFIALALFEEYSVRGYPLFALTTGMGFWPSAVLLSALFGLGHAFNQGETKIAVVGTVLVALFWSFSLLRTGSLWFAVGMHAAWNWGQSFVYGVPDSGHPAVGALMHPSISGLEWLSGGSAGPEGSVLALPLTLLLWVALAARFPRVASCEAGRHDSPPIRHQN
jgi:membrane protease YdiL (CAAX protease family)